MPEFTYEAQSERGMDRGTIDAASAIQAASILRARGSVPITIKPVSRQHPAPARLNAGASTSGIRVPWLTDALKPQITRQDLLLFSRQMHVLLKAGVPILSALASLRESAPNEAMRALLRSLLNSLESGMELSASMGRHPKVFGNFYRSMVKVGEATGRLQEAFLAMFHHIEFDHYMHQQVKSALRYPTFVISVIAVAVTVINIFVIPSFAAVFKGFGAQLPIFTRILVAASEFSLAYWWLIAAFAASAAVLFVAWIRTPEGLLQWHRIVLKIPLAGPILRKAALARFSRSFALALKSGVPVIQALSVVSDTADNRYLSLRLNGMREAIERGESVVRAARSSEVFPAMVLQMMAVGDESGSMDEMMDEVSQMYSSDVQYELKTLSQQIEPILIIAMSALVLVLALGVFLPIWDLGRVAFNKS